MSISIAGFLWSCHGNLIDWTHGVLSDRGVGREHLRMVEHLLGPSPAVRVVKLEYVCKRGREGGREDKGGREGERPWRKWVGLTCSHGCTLQCATLGNNVTLVTLDWNLRRGGEGVRG